MSPYSRQSTQRIKLLACLVGCCALMAADKNFSHLEQLRTAATHVLRPINIAVHTPPKAAEQFSRFVNAQSEILSQNDVLKSENLQLRARLQRYHSLETENTRLRQLLDSSAKLGTRVLVSQLISAAGDPFSKNFRIDKGTRDGVYLGQPVIDAYGVMGQISSVSPDSSVVLLLSDAAHSLPVMVLRNGLRTFVKGTDSSERLNLSYLPEHADILEGDILVTSGLGGRFPNGYPVAQVKEVKRTPGAAFLSVQAQPFAKLDRTSEVLLLWNQQNTSGQSFAGTPNAPSVP